MTRGGRGGRRRGGGGRRRGGAGGSDGEVRDGEGFGLVTVTIIDGRTRLGGLAGVVVTGVVEGRAEAAGLCVGDEAALALPGVVLDVTPTGPPPNPRTAAWERCDPPAVTIMVITAAAATATMAASTAMTATGRGRRRTRCHHRGPAAPTALGNPDGPNVPARCATLTRCARPVGELSAQAVSTCPRSSAGSVAAGRSSGSGKPAVHVAAVALPTRIPGLPEPWGTRRRRHSFRATACSQALSRSGSRRPSSRETAMRKVSSTTSAASGPGSIEWQ